MQKTFTSDDVTIRNVSPTRVAIMEHRGDPATIGATIQRFIAWRKAVGLSPKTSPTFNIFHSDPRTTPPAEYRMDLCVGTDQSVHAKGEQIEVGVIPGGRCASSAILTIWSLRQTTFIATGCRPAVKKRGTSLSTANALLSSRTCRSMRRSRSCSCR